MLTSAIWGAILEFVVEAMPRQRNSFIEIKERFQKSC